MATAQPANLPAAKPLASQGFFNRQWATVANALQRTFLSTPAIRVGLIGPGAAGKTTLIWELLHVAIVDRRPEIGISLVGVNLPEWFNKLSSYPGRTITPIVLYDGPTHLLGKRGHPVQFTVVDSQGQLFHTPTQISSDTNPIRKQILEKMQTVNLLILMLDPATLGCFNNTQDYNPFRTFVDRLLEHNPSAAVAVVYSQVDEYGVPLLDSDVHLLGSDAEEAALENYRNAEPAQRAMAWKNVLDIVASQSTSTQAGDLRRWLVDQSRLLWDLILEMPRRPIYLRAYLASARPVGFRDPKSAGDFREAFEPHHRRGVLQVFADFLTVYRDGLGQRRWRPIGVVVGLLLIAIALGYGFMPGRATTAYDAKLFEGVTATGPYNFPPLLPGSSNVIVRHHVLTLINNEYVKDSRFLEDSIIKGATPKQLPTWLGDITKKFTDNQSELASDKLTPQEVALLDSKSGDSSISELMDALVRHRKVVANIASALNDIAKVKEPGDIQQKFAVLRTVLESARQSFGDRQYAVGRVNTRQWDGLVRVWVVPVLDQIVQTDPYGMEYLTFLRTLNDAEAQPLTDLQGELSNPYSYSLIMKCRNSLKHVKWLNIVAPKDNERPVATLYDRDKKVNWSDKTKWLENIIGVTPWLTTADPNIFPQPEVLAHFDELIFKRKAVSNVPRTTRVYFRARNSDEGTDTIERYIELPSFTVNATSEEANKVIPNLLLRVSTAGSPDEVVFVPNNMVLTGLMYKLNSEDKDVRHRILCRGNEALWLPAVLEGLKTNPDRALVLEPRDPSASNTFKIPEKVLIDLGLLRIYDPFSKIESK